MAATIDNLEIKITAEAGDAAAALDKLATSLANLKSTTKGGFNGIKKAATSINILANAVRFFPLTGLEALKNTLTDLKGIGNVKVGIKTPTASTAEPVGGWYTMPSADSGSGIAPGTVEKVEEVSKSLSKMSVFAELCQKKIASLGLSFASFGAKVSNFFKRVGKIATLMVIRKALQAVMKEISEGFERLYQWDKNLGNGAFASAMDDMASSAKYLGNAVATTLAPILRDLAPIIHRVTDAVVTLMNAIQALYARLTGKSEITIAKRQADEYSESLTSVGKAAKKLKDLLAFDEINRLSDKSSGGSSSGSLLDFSNIFETVDVDSFLDELIGKLREFGRKLRLRIGKWMNSVRDNIPAELRGVFDMIFPWWKNVADALEESAITGSAETIGKIEKEAKDGTDRVFKHAKTTLVHAQDDFIFGANKGLGHFQSVFGKGKFYAENELKTFHDGWGRSFDTTVDSNVKYAEDKSSGLFSTIQQGGGHTFGEMRKSLGEETNTAVKDTKISFSGLSSIFTKDLPADWASFAQGLPRPFQNVMNEISKLINKYMIDPLNTIIKKFNDIFGTNWKTIPRLSEMIGEHGGGGRGFAMGGFPETGQMFFARESGPELVGTIGGHTAVANNNDIVAAVSQGVASAVASVMGGSGSQNIAVNVDGRTLFNIMVNQNNAYVRQTGASPLLV